MSGQLRKEVKYRVTYFKLKSIRLLLLIVGIALNPVDGFTQIEPSIEVEVHQNEGNVAFRFFIEESILYLIKYRTRMGISRLWVQGPREEVIWLISMSKPDRSAVAEEVTYGVVPGGFYQEYPKDTDAPNLQTNTEYEVGVSWGGGAAGRTKFVYHARK